MVNVKDVQLGTTTRKSFAKINEVMPMPNLIEVQKKSYQWFLDEGFNTAASATDASIDFLILLRQSTIYALRIFLSI